VDHSPPSHAEEKNVWSYTFSPHLRFHDVKKENSSPLYITFFLFFLLSFLPLSLLYSVLFLFLSSFLLLTFLSFSNTSESVEFEFSFCKSPCTLTSCCSNKKHHNGLLPKLFLQSFSSILTIWLLVYKVIPSTIGILISVSCNGACIQMHSEEKKFVISKYKWKIFHASLCFSVLAVD